MARGNSPETRRISLDALLNESRSGSRQTESSYPKTKVSDDGTSETSWFDHDTYLLSRDDGPAVTRSNKEGVMTLERYLKQGELHRTGGLPAGVIRRENNTVLTKRYYEEGAEVAGPLGFASIIASVDRSGLHGPVNVVSFYAGEKPVGSLLEASFYEDGMVHQMLISYADKPFDKNLFLQRPIMIRYYQNNHHPKRVSFGCERPEIGPHEIEFFPGGDIKSIAWQTARSLRAGRIWKTTPDGKFKSDIYDYRGDLNIGDGNLVHSFDSFADIPMPSAEMYNPFDFIDYGLFGRIRNEELAEFCEHQPADFKKCLPQMT